MITRGPVVVGTTVSHFRIVEELGRGGMGIVYKAVDTALDRQVALKFLPRHLDTDENAKKRFIHEAKAASALDHTNVCHIHEIGETDEGQMYIAMAFYSGEALDAKVDRGPLTISDAVGYARQAAEGLVRAHAQGIVHRDIKPGNLMVTDEDVLKILDFGVAKMTSGTQLTRTGASVGTTLYMSPEQARGEPADERTDIWALGVVLYELVTGKRPFDSDYEAAVIYSILNVESEFVAKLRPEIPASLERIVETALQKKSDRRFQSMDEMRLALLAVEQELSSGKSKTTSRSLGRKQKHMLSRALAVAVVAVVAVLAVWWRSAGRPVSIAVLPLRYATPDTTQSYLVEGIHESLISDFLRIGGWHVRGRSSVMQFQSGDTPVPEIARRLDVDYVFEGVVDRQGDEVTISARLIDAPSDTYVWGAEFSDRFEDIRILQGAIAEQTASKAGVSLTDQERQQIARARPVDPEAHEAYLRGEYHWGKFTRQDLETALQYFQLSKEKDPNYAPAYAGIAYAWGGLVQMGFLTPAEGSPRILEAARQAVELDSTLAEVHYMMGITHAWYQWDWAGAESDFQRAIAANPNFGDPRTYYAQFLANFGRYDEALQQSEKALELDPISTLYRSLHGWVLIFIERYDAAIDEFESVLNVEPNHLIALDGLWDTFHLKNMYPEALKAARSLYMAMDEPDVVEAFDEGFSEDGYEGAMRRAADLLAGRADSVYSPAYDVARLYINAGEYEKAVDWLERGADEHNPDMPYLGQPLWDPLRGEPKFRALLDRMGLPPQPFTP